MPAFLGTRTSVPFHVGGLLVSGKVRLVVLASVEAQSDHIKVLAGIERHLRDAAIERARLQRDVPTSEMLLEGLRSQAHDDAHRKMNQRFKEEL